MSFQSFSFLAFLCLTLASCLLLGRKDRQWGKLCLGAAGWVFCGIGGGWKSLLILLLGSLVTFFAARFLQPEKEERARRAALIFGVCWHVGVLLVFKYTGFFSGGAVSLGWAPIGLSFFTFQQVWLLKEVYTRQAPPMETHDLLWYGFFFPSLTSGPILRPGDLFPQLEGEKFLRPDGQDFAAGLYAICCGMGKKVLLADPLGGIVNNGWSRVGDLSAPAAWLVILGYTLQLYLDFSGYCDIAAGCARLLGLHLPVNFDSPYRALSVTGFWKRWHMTLTAFLRECVYFPLGGSRKGAARAYLHILLVFLVSGFWHGAGWTFIVWGLLHGLAQIAERLLGQRRERLPKALQWALTFAFVNLAWVFFRAPDLASAVDLLKAAVTGGLTMPQPWLVQGVLSKEVGAVQLLLPAMQAWMPRILIVTLFGGGLLVSLPENNTVRAMDDFRPTVWRAVWLCVVMAWSVLSFNGVATFIYSNF